MIIDTSALSLGLTCIVLIISLAAVISTMRVIQLNHERRISKLENLLETLNQTNLNIDRLIQNFRHIPCMLSLQNKDCELDDRRPLAGIVQTPNEGFNYQQPNL